MSIHREATLFLKILHILSSLPLAVKFLTENGDVWVHGVAAARYLCVLICVSETLLTCPWN